MEEPLTLTQGQFITMSGGDCINTQDHLCVDYTDFAKDVQVGKLILIDDGEIAFTVIDKTNKINAIINWWYI